MEQKHKFEATEAVGITGFRTSSPEYVEYDPSDNEPAARQQPHPTYRQHVDADAAREAPQSPGTTRIGFAIDGWRLVSDEETGCKWTNPARDRLALRQLASGVPFTASEVDRERSKLDERVTKRSGELVDYEMLEGGERSLLRIIVCYDSQTSGAYWYGILRFTDGTAAYEVEIGTDERGLNAGSAALDRVRNQLDVVAETLIVMHLRDTTEGRSPGPS